MITASQSHIEKTQSFFSHQKAGTKELINAVEKKIKTELSSFPIMMNQLMQGMNMIHFVVVPIFLK
jgi:hypothetical protein